ncbi:MAG TPA: GNAT family N-acetyltransferase [Candidatus Dormibacteraeota bacterium]|nr:GNAT family N-acetyltransferase [Candidatus Dormibacteraeota bacterium]
MRFFRTTPRVLPSHPSEAEAIADLYQRAWQGCEQLLDLRLVRDMQPSMGEVRSWLQGGFELYRVEHGGHVVGAIRCTFPASACVLDRLAVDPAVRGQGLGRLLLEHAVSRARRTASGRIWAQVSPKLPAAVALHRDLGFRTVGQHLAAYWGEPLLLLELPL